LRARRRGRLAAQQIKKIGRNVTVAADRILQEQFGLAALARQPNEIERTGFERQIVNVTVGAASIVNFPIATAIPTELPPLDEAHAMQSLSDDGRIILHHVAMGARRYSRSEREGGRNACEAYDTGDFSHRILPSLGMAHFWG